MLYSYTHPIYIYADPVTGKAIVVKTGMGSSAALTTALIAALLQYFDVISLPSSTTSPSDSTSTSTNQQRLTSSTTPSNTTSLQASPKGEEEYNVYQLKRDKTILHNLSQLSHAIAQGKIG